MCNNDELVGRVLSRREIVSLLGAAGAWMLMGCSIGDDDAQGLSPTRSEPTAATSGDAAGTTNTAVTATQPEVPTASTGVHAPTAMSTDATTATTEDDAAEIAAAEVIPACVVSPELTEGPFFVDEGLNRSEILSDPSSGDVVEGANFQLALLVLQATSNGCVPLDGARVDVWHCDANGVYSGVDDPGFSTIGQQFLGGYRMTDSDGIASIRTIYPGWYQGRTVHIHFCDGFRLHRNFRHRRSDLTRVCPGGRGTCLRAFHGSRLPEFSTSMVRRTR